ncbi:DUF2628 domain-containing protein [Fusibacter bizertensis]|uniref:DUF2628 domain-containing protein n=1 Tax=Fusibacter bizertensis TaxID=1488331 RepID=A0ABT6NED2_9FIRM|nr:DUF2628 domain-containing protein [Fusibacter bizertensis]MDH8678783.1 DUF2628 domain-containing protein [Fusibacter bizertensis]
MLEHNENNDDVHSEVINSEEVTPSCEYCGHQVKENDTFCPNCGERLQFKPSLIYGDYKRHQRQSDQESEMAAFIGPNYDFYLKKFEVQNFTESDYTWNWPAFFVSSMWFAYRKLYVHAAVLFVVFTLLNFMGGVGDLIGLGISIYIGFSGNYYYRRYVEDQVEQVKELPYDERQSFYQKKGGTSTVAVLIFIAINFTTSILFNIYY